MSSVILGLKKDNELIEILAKRFKKRRIYKNITQSELAKKSSVSLSKIRTYEQTGKIQFLDLVRIVKAIGEKESIFDFLDFDKKIESEIELDAIIKYETNGKRQRASNKKKV